MVPSISSSSAVLSLQEQCASKILSTNLDNNYANPSQETISSSTLAELWRGLKWNVPEGALGLHHQISKIEKQYQKEHHIPNSQFPLQMNAADLFRRLSKVFSAEFAELAAWTRGEFSLGNRTIPVSCIVYTDLQRILEQKWEDETLCAIWRDPTRGIFKDLITNRAFMDFDDVPRTLLGIRTWLNDPANAVHLNQITMVWAARSKLQVCPREIGKFQALDCIKLDRIGLKKFSCDLTALTQLEYLDLNDNALQNFSCDLTHCAQLRGLNLTRNQLQNFSCDLTACTQLRELKLEGNELESFSSDLTHCAQLEYLNLKDNQLESLSCDLTHCTQLRELNIAGNLRQNISSYHLLPRHDVKLILIDR
jgi:Leucine-rich repeat (LRR) protein